MAQIKELETDKTKKTKVILKLKTQIWTKPRNQVKKKNILDNKSLKQNNLTPQQMMQ